MDHNAYVSRHLKKFEGKSKLTTSLGQIALHGIYYWYFARWLRNMPHNA